MPSLPGGPHCPCRCLPRCPRLRTATGTLPATPAQVETPAQKLGALGPVPRRDAFPRLRGQDALAPRGPALFLQDAGVQAGCRSAACRSPSAPPVLQRPRRHPAAAPESPSAGPAGVGANAEARSRCRRWARWQRWRRWRREARGTGAEHRRRQDPPGPPTLQRPRRHPAAAPGRLEPLDAGVGVNAEGCGSAEARRSGTAGATRPAQPKTPPRTPRRSDHSRR